MMALVMAFAGDFFPSHLMAARWQMAFTLGFHIILASFGVGLPVLMLLAEGMYLRTRDRGWRSIAIRWSRAFAVLFALGAVSGTVLSFELGLLWPEFMARFGTVIGLPFALEAIAFFLEAVFVGIYLYGWKRLSPWAHWLAGFPIAIGGLASAWFVVTVNAWMNVPAGFRLAEGTVVDVDPVAAMLNPATGAQTTHMIVAAYLVTGFVTASCYAVGLLRGRESLAHRRAFAIALIPAAILAPLQIVVGHWSAQVVARTQPVKLAAMEGQFETEAQAPLRLGGLPYEEARATRYALEIRGGLSWLAYGDAQTTVRGLNEFRRDETPPVRVVHVAFQVMVAAGMLFLCVSIVAGWCVTRHRTIPYGSPFLFLVAFCGPLSIAALEAGWVVTEVGRQPWTVQGILRTADAVTEAPGTGWILTATVAVYGVLAVGAVVVLRVLASTPLADDSDAY
jgi:cytochrome d ubiquinol oxidase subunit I